MDKRLKLIKGVCERDLGLDLKEKTRKRHYVFSRCIYYKVANELTPLSLNMIGKSLGYDHATVIYSLKNFQRDIYENPGWKEKYLTCHSNSKVYLMEAEKMTYSNKRSMLHHNINLKQMVKNLKEQLEKIPLNVRLKYL